MTPRIRTEDLIDAQSVADLLGLSHRSTVSSYQKRCPEMPRPVVDLGRGRPRLWLRTEIVRSVFSAPDHATAMTQLHEVATMLSPRFPQAAELLEDAAEDVLAHMYFPREHRKRLHSTNPIERLHKEVKRRTRVIGIFPTLDSLMRIIGTLLA